MNYLITLLAIIIMFPTSAQEAQNCACCTIENQQFDFWVGEWDVYDTNGKHVGSNSIVKIQGNCVLQENWTSATPGFTGTSYNFFNKQSKKWEQIWIDNSGSSLHLIGKRIENQMVLKTEPISNADNKLVYNQITWTLNNDGTVRQLWEVFTEGADTQVAFDGLYKPRG